MAGGIIVDSAARAREITDAMLEESAKRLYDFHAKGASTDFHDRQAFIKAFIHDARRTLLAAEQRAEQAEARVIELLKEFDCVSHPTWKVVWCIECMREVRRARERAEAELREYEGVEGRCPKGHNKRFTYKLAERVGCVGCELEGIEAERDRLREVLEDSTELLKHMKTDGLANEEGAVDEQIKANRAALRGVEEKG